MQAGWVLRDGRGAGGRRAGRLVPRRTAGRLVGRAGYDGALLLPRTRSIHSFGMRFPSTWPSWTASCAWSRWSVCASVAHHPAPLRAAPVARGPGRGPSSAGGCGSATARVPADTVSAARRRRARPRRDTDRQPGRPVAAGPRGARGRPTCVCCEDTRRTRALLSAPGSRPIRGGSCPCTGTTRPRGSPRSSGWLGQGRTVARGERRRAPRRSRTPAASGGGRRGRRVSS